MRRAFAMAILLLSLRVYIFTRCNAVCALTSKTPTLVELCCVRRVILMSEYVSLGTLCLKLTNQRDVLDAQARRSMRLCNSHTATRRGAVEMRLRQ